MIVEFPNVGKLRKMGTCVEECPKCGATCMGLHNGVKEHWHDIEVVRGYYGVHMW